MDDNDSGIGKALGIAFVLVLLCVMIGDCNKTPEDNAREHIRDIEEIHQLQQEHEEWKQDWNKH